LTAEWLPAVSSLPALSILTFRFLRLQRRIKQPFHNQIDAQYIENKYKRNADGKCLMLRFMPPKLHADPNAGRSAGKCDEKQPPLRYSAVSFPRFGLVRSHYDKPGDIDNRQIYKNKIHRFPRFYSDCSRCLKSSNAL
jgi:hypothetical protein